MHSTNTRTYTRTYISTKKVRLIKKRYRDWQTAQIENNQPTARAHSSNRSSISSESDITGDSPPDYEIAAVDNPVFVIDSQSFFGEIDDTLPTYEEAKNSMLQFGVEIPEPPLYESIGVPLAPDIVSSANEGVGLAESLNSQNHNSSFDTSTHGESDDSVSRSSESHSAISSSAFTESSSYSSNISNTNQTDGDFNSLVN